jgi:hypothetical protein
MPRKSTHYVDTEDSRMPDLSKIVSTIQTGIIPPREAQRKIVELLLAQPAAKLLAERYAYHIIDDALQSAPAAPSAITDLMAWSMAVATAELLTRRVEKQLADNAKPIEDRQ